MTNILEHFKLQGKVSIISGGTIGIGQSTALAQAGVQIIIADHNVSPTNKTLSGIKRSEDIETVALKVDITDPTSVNQMLNNVIEQFGKIDMLVNKVGMTYNVSEEELTFENWNKVMNLNLNGIF
ncbi:SDR family NAD(P)-dependent oxidoreductase [Mammaliicoccus sciuri]|uniref:SDR family NAD(P)-dependent oxidoreductase n=1 Tax=Mammaliicoccus sciuri TaxID=1296 RepID=UPI0009BD2EFB|nr:SDR family NAD(P)-dependent oxidoreductase [Mammaliicoccus sciuri]MBO1218627.1 SDR family NAD(P)-dependent oxidoreductase [Mammaliicoccus sciuri]MBO1231397.1 SDR family NAD(P)-dependent oxidoreductase [Mammaliicoccus sciuri]MDQ7130867.1 SDR family NAD(P)-dependent oxidoreductase [Mammaliicoccus sciuri]QDR65174.1 SDR family oxidoreductase [Mammaliicoccus sciuri]RIN85485.1 SDR family NAD(P)-dependent oxidoreductase [Mammaliicoccus sciuri]